MYLYLISIFHLVHCPLLLIYPYLIDNRLYDKFYINYFYLIIISYTYTNKKCLISLIYKNLINNYELEHPEMAIFTSNIFFIKLYFIINTLFYGVSLYNVINRNITNNSIYLINNFTICCYLGFFIFNNYYLDIFVRYLTIYNLLNK